MEKQTIEMEHSKETKNTHRYDSNAEGEPPAVDNLYIKKWATGKKQPEKVKVTVEEVEE